MPIDNKKVLFIAYHFPPDAAVGSVRPAKFVKYLKQFGWEPLVLTIREDHILLSDQLRMREVENIYAVRTRVLPTVLQFALKVRAAIVKLNRRGNSIKAQSGSTIFTPNPGHGNGASSKPKFFSRYLDSIFETPDKQIGWLIPALWSAYRLVRKNGIRVVVTTSPPQTCALVGLALSYLAPITLITDLRDPWFRPIWQTNPSQTWISRGLMSLMEKKLIQRSAGVITTTEEYRTFLRSFYPNSGDNKFNIIWNGFDEEDFEDLKSIEPNSKFTVSYLGTFYFGRSPRIFLQALSDLIASGNINKGRVDVRFIGDVRFAEGEPVEEMVRHHGLDDCVKICDTVSYRNSLKAMKQSHVLLLFAPEQYYCIPAKAFEYLGSGRNILCFSQDGATGRLMQDTGAGLVVEPSDLVGIKFAILLFYNNYHDGSSLSLKPKIYKYTRKSGSMELARIIENSISN